MRFKERLLQMRRGSNPYAQMLRSVPVERFSNSATPTLGGMVRGPHPNPHPTFSLIIKYCRMKSPTAPAPAPAPAPAAVNKIRRAPREPLPACRASSWPGPARQMVASAFAQYYIFAYVLFAALCAATSGPFWADVFGLDGNTPARIVFEAPAPARSPPPLSAHGRAARPLATFPRRCACRQEP